MTTTRILLSAVSKRVRQSARSPWLSLVAAGAVVLGTVGTFVSGSIAADVQTCDLRRELLQANGSAELRAGRSAMQKASEARTYLALAFGTQDLEQRREYAFLGVTAANISIMANPSSPGARMELLSFPSDEQLSSLRDMAALADRVNNLDIAGLRQTLRVHDENFAEQLSDLAECEQPELIGRVIGALAMLFTLLSVALIGLREFHQARRRPNRRRTRRLPKS